VAAQVGTEKVATLEQFETRLHSKRRLAVLNAVWALFCL